MHKQSRIEELEKKSVMTLDEWNEFISLCPPGSIVKMPDADQIGITDTSNYVANANIGVDQAEKAYQSGFYIETISIVLQLIELPLRMYVVSKSKKGKAIDPAKDKRTFGNYVNDCKNLGFDLAIIDRLEAFNEVRVKAIHKFVTGEIEYEVLKSICDDCQELLDDVQNYVAIKVGIPLT